MPKSTPWPADQVERRPVASLIAYARNSRTHSPAQVDQIAASVREWGWTTPVLVAEDNTILAGHGRVLAAQKLGLKEVPVMVARGWSEAQKRAYVLADNQLALNAGWNQDLLKIEMADLQAADFNLELTGFSPANLADLIAGKDIEPPPVFDGPDATRDSTSEGGEDAAGESGEPGEDGTYTRKVVAPIYEPTGPCPAVADLVDETKTLDLLAAIAAADLPTDVAAFLRKAAERHTSFHFGRIAEFYAHADADVQRLMEQSALVIIDFNQAIENGFVQLSKRLGALVARDYPAEAGADA